MPYVTFANLRNWGIGLAFGVAGCFANIYLALDLGFGLHFVFGSIFLYPALRFFGPVAAIISAGVAGMATLHLWGHPWALVILICEAGVVSWFWRRRKPPFIFLVVGYWILIGMPLVFMFYAGIIGMDVTATWLVAVKQAFNSIVASAIGTLVAGLVVSCLPAMSEARLSSIIPHRLMIVGLFPIAVLVWTESGRHADEVDRVLASELERSLAPIELALNGWMTAHFIPLDYAAADFLQIYGSGVQQAEELLDDVLADPVVRGFGVYTSDGQIAAWRGDPAVFPQNLPSRFMQDEASAGLTPTIKIQNVSANGDFQICVSLIRRGKTLGFVVAGIAADSIKITNLSGYGVRWFRISLPDGGVLVRGGDQDFGQLAETGVPLKIEERAYRVASPDYDGSNVMLNHWNAWLVRDMMIPTLIGELRLEAGVPYRAQINAFRAEQAVILTVALGLLLAIALISLFAYRQIASGLGAVSSALHAMRELNPIEANAFPTSIPDFAEAIAIARETNESLCEQSINLKELAGQLGNLTKMSAIIVYTLQRKHDEKWQLVYMSVPGPKMAWFDQGLFASREDWIEGIHPDDRTILDGAVAQFRQSGTRSAEYRIRSLDEDWRWIQDDCEVIADDPVSGVQTAAGAIMDIHARRLEGERLTSSARLITLGEMATSMAHEINQPLNTIRMASENALFELEDPADGKVDLEYLGGKFSTVVAQTERAAAIIDHMRIFGRRTNDLPEPFRAEDAIGGALAIAGPQVRTSGITLDFEVIGESLPDITGHQQLLEQVIINLVLNARDAILAKSDRLADQTSFKGCISIRGEHQKLSDAIVVQVEDNGGGVPAFLKGRLFDPFFTTKPAGKGTGLGLSVSFGIVSEMNGTIACLDGDEGAIFEVRIPVGAPRSKEVAPEMAGAVFESKRPPFLAATADRPTPQS